MAEERVRVVPGVDARLFLYPPTDLAFIRTVETSLAPLQGRPVEDASIVAAAEVLLKTSYPLANIEVRPDTSPSHRGPSWDVFRDGAVLDEELVRRARAGQSAAADRLHDRHHDLAYAVAVRVCHEPAAAESAVEAAFHGLIVDDLGAESVGIRWATAARDAALRSVTVDEQPHDGPDGLSERQLAIIELAHIHRLLDTEIATVLRTDVGEVRGFTSDLSSYQARSRGALRDALERVVTPPGD